ncbi:CMP/dCMP kinase [Thermoflexales bacterium]|nr:CMP/dCMP kinase [Thermoflexales bacterium]
MAVITISRQYGSEGDKIAANVCQILGYQSFDKQLMMKVAAEVGLTEGEVVDFGEDQHQVRSFLDRLLGNPPLLMTQARTWSEVKVIDAADSIPLVQSIIRAACKHDNIVIVGRGGQAVLRNDPGVLHVRIEAPLETRISRVQLREGLTFELARDVVAERDRAAADYLKRFYNIDWSDSLLYHLIINTGPWSIEAASRLIVTAVSQLQLMAALN